MKKDEMDRASGMHGTGEKFIQGWRENVKERDRWDDLGGDGLVMLVLI
jgi:hypothetical protein